MHLAGPLTVAVLVALAINVIGCFYLFAPARIAGSFGLKPPSSDPDSRAWLRLKGIRDIASGSMVLTLMMTAGPSVVGTALLVFAIIPLGDMLTILVAGGDKSKAYFVHGLTCTVMIFAGLLLVQVI